MSRTSRVTIPLALAALGVGFFAGWTSSHDGTGDAPRTVSDPNAPQQRDEGPERPGTKPKPRRIASDRFRNPRAEQSMFSAALLAHARERFAETWQEHRGSDPSDTEVTAALGEFQSRVLALPGILAEARADQLNRQDSAQEAMTSGDGIAILAAIGDGTLQLTADEVCKTVDDCVSGGVAGDFIEGPSLATGRSRTATKGMTIRFGAGVHALPERRLRGASGEPFPPDVSIVGAGMNSTLLRIGDISIAGDVERLSFRHLTLDAGNDGLFDLRGGGLTLDLENVRVLRFDAGHGGCQIFTGRKGIMVRARDCEFMGGYGRSPGGGTLFRGQPVLARFARCRFELLQLGLQHHRRGLVVFQNCVFDLLVEDPMGRAWNTVEFKGCRVERLRNPGTPRATFQKKLSDLFPGGP